MEAKPVALTARNGKRIAFRSKLEARWAMYFDLMGMKWKYEPFRYDIGKRVTYTPDFSVPEIGTIEVKPNLEMLSESAGRIAHYVRLSGDKVYALCGKTVVIMHGSPLVMLHLSSMQQTIILGGTSRRRAAIEDYGMLNQAVQMALNSTLYRKQSFDAELTCAEVMLLQDTRPDPVTRRKRKSFLDQLINVR